MTPHHTTLRVRYEETDQMGVVYHANYLRYFEVGRTELLRSCGMTYRALEEAGTLLAVVDVQLKYHAAARYDDVLEVVTTIGELRKTRVVFGYEIRRDDALLVSGATTLACLDATRKPRRLPPEILAALT